MRYTDKQGNSLNLNECMTAESFFMEADVYIDEPMEMYFNQQGELRAGKRPKTAIAHLQSDSSELLPTVS